MHNRARMIAAMYLTKDLMIDWRLGERVSYLLSFLVRSLQTKTLFPHHSISCSNSLTAISPRITVVGNGAQAPARTHSHTFASLTLTPRVKKPTQLAITSARLSPSFAKSLDTIYITPRLNWRISWVTLDHWSTTRRQGRGR